jgi:hypothetical protein
MFRLSSAALAATLFGGFFCAPGAVRTAAAAAFDVKAYGAKGDGATLDTAAIQKAIDAAARVRGVVVLPPGVYRSGALFLKSGVELRVEKGATLLGSQNIADYPTMATRIAGIEMAWPAALVNVYEQAGVTVGGAGLIDGDGKKWWDLYWKMRREEYEPKGVRWAVDYDCRRPRLIQVFRSTDVELKGLRLERPGFWTVHVCYSRRVVVDGLDIRNNTVGRGPSTDGIDIDSSSEVTVTRCRIECNDDAICLKAGRDADGLRVARPTEKVAIRDNTVVSGAAGVTIGSETSGGVREIDVDGLKVLAGAPVGILFKSASTRGGVIENIRIRNVEMTGVATPVSVALNWNPSYSYARIPQGMTGYPDYWRVLTEPVPPEKGLPRFRKVRIENVKATGAQRAIQASAYAGAPLEDFEFVGLDIEARTAGSIANAERWTFRDVKLRIADGGAVAVKDSRAVVGLPGPSTPGVGELPARPRMPDPLARENGARVKTAEEWRARREEIRRILEHYAVGRMPPAPGNVTGAELQAETVAGGKVRYRLLRLTFGPERRLSLHVGVFTPIGAGPHAAIILQGGTPPGAPALPRQPLGANQGKGQDVMAVVGPGPNPVTPPAPPAAGAEAVAARFADVFRRGYALALFNPNDCAEDTTLRNPDGGWAFRNTRFPPAYPGYDWGILGAWAWGVSRVADYLVTDPAIDKGKLIVTGASRNGKSAMIAAAFDERLMGAPVVTGGGGVGAYRFAGPRRSETLDVMQTKYPNWFSPNLRQFRGAVEKLPFDQHWFVALCAPRPFLALEGMTDTISLPEAVRQTFLGAAPVYELLGAKGRLGVNYARHGHAFTEEDWTALMDFADQQWFGKKNGRAFDRFPTEAELDAALAAAPPRTR